MASYCGLYAIVNLANGHFYIGSSVDIHARFAVHRSTLRSGKHRNEYLQRAWNKYGAEAFRFQVLITCRPDQVRTFETLVIEGTKPQYNLTDCVDGEVVCSEHRRLAVSAALKGRPFSAEHKANLSAAHRGLRQTPEHIEHRVASIRGRPRGAVWQEIIRRPKSPETKAKMSSAAKLREAKRRAK